MIFPVPVSQDVPGLGNVDTYGCTCSPQVAYSNIAFTPFNRISYFS